MRCLTLLWVVSVMISVNVQAQVYRWVDEQGQVNFSNHPPEHGDSEQIQVRSQPKLSNAETPMASSPKDQTNDAETPKQVTIQEDRITPQQRAEYCRTAQANKARLSENFNRRVVAPDGSVRRLEDAERAKLLQQIQSNIDEYCR